MSDSASDTRGRSLRWFGILKLWPFLRPFAPSMAVMVLFGFLGSACDAAFPLFNRAGFAEPGSLGIRDSFINIDAAIDISANLSASDGYGGSRSVRNKTPGFYGIIPG